MDNKKMYYEIKIPQGVNFDLDNSKLVFSSSKSKISRDFSHYRIKLTKKENSILIEGLTNDRKTSVMVKTIISHIKNICEGLLYGYKYELKIVYSHFPMTAEVNGKKVIVKNFLGEKFPREAKIVGDSKVEIKGHDVTVTGYNLEEVSQTSTNLELATKVKGRDIRRFQDGVYLSNKTNIESKPEDFLVELIRGNGVE
jgi:large subunit ribosomal protein L6